MLELDAVGEVSCPLSGVQAVRGLHRDPRVDVLLPATLSIFVLPLVVALEPAPVVVQQPEVEELCRRSEYPPEPAGRQRRGGAKALEEATGQGHVGECSGFEIVVARGYKK